ncbi:MAG TPA: 3-hydroxyacyl-CoA dehydrogenase NAD-binding domain-containing protein, partial [Chitinophagaceae bacterium]|nr:3-hydroxyacyl-CoA dehydrogenase NAD-binding domain-containing protein [Chitinophagaceae bacterium]
MSFSKICIAGAGTMGAGIAQVTAAAGYDTLLFEVNPTVLGAAQARIEAEVRRLAEKGKITAEAGRELLGRIRYTSEVSDCRADLIIEAIIEKEEAKTALFRALAESNGPATVLASNTSSLSLSA